MTANLLPPLNRREAYFAAIAGEGTAPDRPLSREEALLDNILGAGHDVGQPCNIYEALLANCAGASYEVPAPQSNVEALLHNLAGDAVPYQPPRNRLEAYLELALGGGLPEGYREVSGLTFNTARFITSLHMRGSDTLRFTYMATANCNVLGAFDGANTDSNFCLYHTASSPGDYVRYDGELKRSLHGSNERVSVVMTPTGFNINGDVGTWEQKTFESESTVYIGTLPNSSSARFAGTLYGRIIVDGRAEFIPCEHDGALGYYERRSGSWLLPDSGTVTEASV